MIRVVVSVPIVYMYRCGLYSYGLYGYGRYSYGLYGYGLYSYGLYSNGLCSYDTILVVVRVDISVPAVYINMPFIVIAHTDVPIYIVMAYMDMPI